MILFDMYDIFSSRIEELEKKLKEKIKNLAKYCKSKFVTSKQQCFLVGWSILVDLGPTRGD